MRKDDYEVTISEPGKEGHGMGHCTTHRYECGMALNQRTEVV